MDRPEFVDSIELGSPTKNQSIKGLVIKNRWGWAGKIRGVGHCFHACKKG